MASTKGTREVRAPRTGDIEPAPFAGQPDDDCEIEDVVLSRKSLGGETYRLVDWRYATFDACSLVGSTWKRSHFTDVSFSDCDLANAVFDNSGFERVLVSRGRMTGFTASGCALADLRVEDAVADLSVWRFAKLEHVAFRDTRLTQADWTSASLKNVRFDGCDLSGADFTNCAMESVTFERCSFVGVRGVAGLHGAAIDRAALLDLTEPMAASLGIVLPADD